MTSPAALYENRLELLKTLCLAALLMLLPGVVRAPILGQGHARSASAQNVESAILMKLSASLQDAVDIIICLCVILLLAHSPSTLLALGTCGAS